MSDSTKVIYQLFVDGSSAVLDNHFTMHSKKVFQEYPSQEDIDEFINLCAKDDPNYFDYLDINKPYRIKVLELNLI